MMNFIDSYKKLEKLCNEMYGDKHGVSLYIDEMINTPVGSRYVKSWNEDLNAEQAFPRFKCVEH